MNNSNFKFEDRYRVKQGDYEFYLRPGERNAMGFRLDDPEFAKVVLKKFVEAEIFAEFEYALREHSNVVMNGYGNPNSGKSTILKISILSLIDMANRFNKKITLKTTYNFPDSIHEISEYGLSKIEYKKEHGDYNHEEILIIFQDEDPTVSGHESRSYDGQLNNLLETVRQAQIYYFVAAPKIRSGLRVCNIFVEAIAKDRGNKTNWGIVYFREDLNKNKIYVAGSALFHLTDRVDETFSDYDEMKMNNLTQLMKNRGLQTVSINMGVIENGARVLIERAKEIGVRSKSHLETLAKTMGLGTVTTTAAIIDHAKLLWEIQEEEEREKNAALLDKEKTLQQEEKEKRIRKLVVEVARELFHEFNFMSPDLKSPSRKVQGWIMERYQEDWIDLIPHVKYMWYLAEYWQYTSLEKSESDENKIELDITSTDRTLLRESFLEALKIHFSGASDTLLSRTAWYFIFEEEFDRDSWSQAEQARHIRMKPSTLQTYWSQPRNKKFLHEVKHHNKVWGDAGELYFAMVFEKMLKKGKVALEIDPELTHELIVAAVDRSRDLGENEIRNNIQNGINNSSGRSSRVTTSLYDVEVWINGRSVAAINTKFAYIEPREWSIKPECEHENPYLFLINKETLEEMLIPSKTGNDKLYVTWGERASSLKMKEFISSIVK